MRVLVLMAVLILFGCEKKKAFNLKHLIKTSYEKPSGCRERGPVTGTALINNGFTRSYESSLKSILKETYAKGGNFVYIQRASTDGTSLIGISYSCNDLASAR